MNKIWSPNKVHTPPAKYNHCALVPKNSRILHIAGQLGIDINGELGESVEQQVLLAWRNVWAILQENNMSIEDIFNVRIYLTDRVHLLDYAKAREKLFDISGLPITLLFVKELFSPDWKIEIEVQAAKQ